MTKNSDTAARLQAVIDTAIDGIITINTSGIIETINPAACELFGYKREEVLGQRINMLMPSPFQEEHDYYISRYLKTKEPYIIGIGREVQGLKKDGSIFPFRLAVSEVILNKKTIFTGIIHDLTHVKQAEERILKLNEELEQKVDERTNELEMAINQLLKTNKRLNIEISDRKRIEKELKNQEQDLKISLEKEKELNELKSRFVSMASHEFRTPLSTILSSANLISRYLDAEHQFNREKHVNKIKSAVSHLTSILNDFLSLSKLEEGKFQTEIEELDLIALCRSSVEDIRGLMKKDQIIEIHHTGSPIKIISGPRILKNILFNLFSNAIKYSKEGSRIDIFIDFNQRPLEIAVMDEGVGVPENEQKYLFDRFFRGSNVLNTEGTGLGLNIVQRYVKLIGGQIQYKDRKQGSQFIVQIPNLKRI